MNFKRSATLLLVGLMAISMVAMPAMAASSFNPDATAGQNPYISTDVTVSNFDRSTMSPGEYEDDSGDVTSLPATVNQSSDVDDLGVGTVNPYSFVASDIDFDDGSAFPHAEDNVSAVNNESKWTTDAANGGSITVSDSSTAAGVEALEVSTSSQTSSDYVTATFSDVSITSDVEKRYLQTIIDVDSLDSGATVELRPTDADGDYVSAEINSSASASDSDVIGTATGEGYVLQQQVGDMTVAGSGDGTMDEIDSVEINVTDADATIRLAALNVDKTSEWSFGDERNDDNNDDEFETDSIKDVSTAGQIDIYNIDSMGPTFDNAEINDLEMPMNFRAQDLEDDDTDRVNVTFSAATDYPSFENKQTAYYRLKLPSAYDLTYSNAVLRQDFDLPDSRFQDLEIVEGASDTEFADLSGWTDKSDSVSSGDDVILDDTIQPGTEIAFKSVTLVTDDERTAIENVGGVVGPAGGSDGIIGGVTGFFGTLWGKLTGVLGGGALASRIFGGD
jgi:hypothetical protein